MSRRLTKDEFIQRSIAVHGNKYGYESVEYESSHKKVAIDCKKHGLFMQTPDKHMSGRGCPKCKIDKIAVQNQISFEEFLVRARVAHGWKYEYDKSTYVNLSQKIRIICPIHGEFWQLAQVHVLGHGCTKCFDEQKRGKTLKYTTKSFIEKANQVHKWKYDYSKVEYKAAFEPVTIICPTHGEFRQKASEHLSGKGCHRCAGTKKLTTDEFIAKAIEKHGDKYDYSLVRYNGNKRKVAIICKEHGVFYQTPNDHLYGKACPYCQESIGERNIRRFLESNGIRFEQEKRFPDCRNVRVLPFDFYLSEVNTCIEFQGEQHYNENSFFDGYGGLKGLQCRDQIKRDYCASRGIKLIEIRYDQNIEQELKKHLQV